jgi:uncharacterized phage protein (TIGR01671 family)
MREFKFRVWHKNYKKYLHLGSCDFDEGREMLMEISFRPEPIVVSRVFGELDEQYDDVVMEQYTGLKDVDGKEIYEGDIVHCIIEQVSERGEFEDYVQKWKGVVEYKKNRFGIWNENDVEFSLDIDTDHWSVKEFKVVGNIHEN